MWEGDNPPEADQLPAGQTDQDFRAMPGHLQQAIAPGYSPRVNADQLPPGQTGEDFRAMPGHLQQAVAPGYRPALNPMLPPSGPNPRAVTAPDYMPADVRRR